MRFGVRGLGRAPKNGCSNGSAHLRPCSPAACHEAQLPRHWCVPKRRSLGTSRTEFREQVRSHSERLYENSGAPASRKNATHRIDCHEVFLCREWLDSEHFSQLFAGVRSFHTVSENGNESNSRSNPAGSLLVMFIDIDRNASI